MDHGGDLDLALDYAKRLCDSLRGIRSAVDYVAGAGKLGGLTITTDDGAQDEAHIIASGVADVRTWLSHAESIYAECSAALTLAHQRLAAGVQMPGVALGERRYDNAHDAILAAARQYATAISVWDDDHQPAMPGEPETPISADNLRANLVDCCRGIVDDPEAPDVAELDRLLRLARQERVAATEAPRQDSLPDGPCGAFQWRYRGELIADKMQPAAWRLCSHLYPDKAATFDELKAPVYQDAEHVADANAFGSLRRAANKYFREHAIPHSLTIAKTSVTMTAS